ncbi:xaa-Arg dipeptidase-like [Dermacentor albipictus]|uniref:xaa-Arg dipeptidase-like n=1 Tax=Dermacentor albipictus TaxID=60249 RepID=UPI0031FC7F88
MACGSEEQQREQRWRALSEQLLSEPELAFHEQRAHDLICAELEREGFAVRRNYVFCTAFRAEYQFPPEPASVEGITVGLVCEYDALPGLGHACGHNLVAAGTLAAASAIRRRMEKEQVHGRLVVFGVPGSEAPRPCCKSQLLDQGELSGLTALLALHPTSARDLGCCPGIDQETAGQWLDVRFRGAAALDAAVLSYWLLASRCRGIVSQGGRNPCEPTTRSESQYVLLASDDAQLCVRRQVAEDALLGVAKATGCFLECRFGKPRPRPVFSRTLEQLYSAEVQKTGVPPPWFSCSSGQWYGAWSDWGRVSRALPCLRASYTLPGAFGAPHSRAFAEAVSTPHALTATFEAADALATTALKLLVQRGDTLVAQHRQQQAHVPLTRAQ